MTFRVFVRTCGLCAVLTAAALPAHAQRTARRPLASGDIASIARLEMLEDRREFDSTFLATALADPHPEVRRRTVITLGRLNDKRGIDLLRSRTADRDTAVIASAVFAIGQIRDTSTIAWLDSILNSTKTAPTVATEAAIALGKINSPAIREVLTRYLAAQTVGPRSPTAVGQALLSMARPTGRPDLAPIIRWTKSPIEETRWSAAWALYRTRSPEAVAPLLALSKDPSPLIRSWAVRGLTRVQADSATLAVDAEARLVAALRDVDRTVRTEALRALGTYTDSTAIVMMVSHLYDADSWMSVSAAEALGNLRATTAVPQLMAATAATRPCALRLTAMQALQKFSMKEAVVAALDIVRDTVPYCRNTAAAALRTAMSGRGGGRGGLTIDSSAMPSAEATLQTFLSSRRADLSSKDLLTRIAAVKSLGTFGDSTDLSGIRALRAQADTQSSTGVATASALAAIDRRMNPPAPAPAGGRGGAGGGAGRGAAPAPTRTLDDYRRIVEKWIVPDYNGAPHPVAHWETSRGPIDIELFPGDAPLSVDEFVRTMKAGAIAGAEFIRVVPDFVDQQDQSVGGGPRQRDEVNRHGLVRRNLAWATSGLDTGSPGYTLGHTPQPHNEGNFTAMGRVTGSMTATDRIQLGDRVIGGRMK